MPKLFDYENNFFTDVINKYFDGYEISEEPDFLFYSVFGIEHYKFDDCVKIFITEEACSPDFNECDYAIAFDWMQYEDRYLRRPLWIEERRFYNNYYKITDEEALNRKFCNFVYYNDNSGEGTDFRKKFVKRLSEYKRVDCPGKVLNNMTANLIGRFDGDWRKSKVDFVKDYKFTIAFENTQYRGYTTEKVLHPFVGRSVPIYWGNPLVEKDINKNAIINCNGYEQDIDKIIDKIIEIDQDSVKYLEMIHANPMSNEFNVHELEYFELFIKNILEKGNEPYNRDPRNFAKRMGINSMSRMQKINYFFLGKSKI